MVNIPTMYGDDWGMVYHCYSHIKHHHDVPTPPSYVFRTDALAKSSGMSSTHMTILGGKGALETPRQ